MQVHVSFVFATATDDDDDVDNLQHDKGGNMQVHVSFVFAALNATSTLN